MEEKRLERQQVFAGKILDVYKDTVSLPNGNVATREVVEHAGAVAVLAIDEQGQIVMVRQYRYPMQEVMLEIPAGKLEANEEPLECAKRELEEETGYIAANWEKIFSLYTSPGFANEVIHIFLARDLQYVGCNPDDDEFVEAFKASVEVTIEDINSGMIRDAKTVSAVLWWKSQLS
ncbi:NUDIX domain-containing protein [Desulfuribacillus alkaliarsenatis]|uniref:ADP-ribose pyrophosphatase n=1 Tax=Desulfuribacillus alkaliarsenatis TaxID=766136 RepID=A0A1E5G5S8_9FIRM|nr:NUDIX hydrolase [Desulfuribacillus alkaliarsenatis]OEF98469.1 ADP-ribose pyrophosphatase [Desulfuribacillus alkaliarsenatis]